MHSTDAMATAMDLLRPGNLPALLASVTTWVTLLGLSVGYLTARSVYRLYFHPLARFPGPKVAAVSIWYELYYDLICGGRYTWEIKAMHVKYGPIVRISPHEIHINDPDYYSELYAGASNPRDRWDRVADIFSIPTAHFSTVPHELHRARRAPVNQFFSKRMVSTLSPNITAHVEKLSKRLAAIRGTGKPVSLKYAYAALALDVVTEYSFARSYAALDDPEFSPEWADTVDGFVRLVYMNVVMPWFAPLMKSLPLWAVKIMNPAMMEQIRFQLGLRSQIEAIMRDPEKEKYNLNGHPTIFHELIQNEGLLPSDRNIDHFQDEGQSVVAAGQVTTAYHMSATTFFVLSNPDVLRKLKAELKKAMPDANALPSLAKLEELEYLSAVISEGHRVTHGVVHRMQRISPKLPLIYKDWTIPAGVPVGISALMVHENAEIYPEPAKFDPSRFLGAEGAVRRQKYLVPFSKGTRSCLGQNLAMAEIYFALAMVFRRFDMKIHETEEADVVVAHDYIVPMTRVGSKGVRVTVE